MAISDEIKHKKQLIKLRAKINHMRFIWRNFARKNALMNEVIQATSDRSETKTLYFLERGDWSVSFQIKLKYLQKKIDLLGCEGAKKPKTLWLPTVIEHATTVTFVISQAKSTRKLTIAQARAFAEKYGYKKPNPKFSYTATYLNGRDCNLRVKCKNTVNNYHFTNWAVCLFDGDKLPKIKRIDNTIGLFPSEPILYRHGVTKQLGMTDKI